MYSTHHFFSSALQRDDEIGEEINGNIILTAYDEENDENLDLPYIIVSHQGTTNDQGTKDDSYESDTDRDTISIEVAAETDEEVARLAAKVRATILRAIREDNTHEENDESITIEDYTLSTNGIIFDWTKPCFWTTLTYTCETLNNA